MKDNKPKDAHVVKEDKLVVKNVSLVIFKKCK